jgi:hypothetical protein
MLDRNLFELIDDLHRPSRPHLGHRLGTAPGRAQYGQALIDYILRLETYTTDALDRGRRAENAIFGGGEHPRALSRPRTDVQTSQPRVGPRLFPLFYSSFSLHGQLTHAGISTPRAPMTVAPFPEPHESRSVSLAISVASTSTAPPHHPPRELVPQRSAHIDLDSTTSHWDTSTATPNVVPAEAEAGTPTTSSAVPRSEAVPTRGAHIPDGVCRSCSFCTLAH